MNLFILDEDQEKSVQSHCDRHVVKMILECAQILTTAHYLCDGELGEGWYKPTHQNHPVVRWAAETTGNYQYVYRQFELLSAEYTWRYGKTHLSWTRMGGVLHELPWDIRVGRAIEFYLAMPVEYGGRQRARLAETVRCYRAYYSGEKRRMFKWTGRPTPGFLVS